MGASNLQCEQGVKFGANESDGASRVFFFTVNLLLPLPLQKALKKKVKGF